MNLVLLLDNSGSMERADRVAIIREALRVYELVEQEDNDPQLEAALRHALRSPLKKYKPGHFAALTA